MVRFAILFSDNAIAGYLLICLAIAFLTIASVEEVLSGTAYKLLQTKFIEASRMHLFVESALYVNGLVMLAYMFGPILGGVINTAVGMSKTCISMGVTGSICLFFYFVFSIIVHCITIH